MGRIEISTDPARVDVDVVHRFLSESAYWALGRPRETVERSIRHSLCFSVFCDDRQIGFARVVSDRAVFAYLMDVFILPEWRGHGLAKQLMQAIVTHPELQGLTLFLLRTSDAHGLYRQFGFEAVEQPENLLARRRAASASPPGHTR
jgi:N-acetylglutamate synthase-like GNAT family acetyltransferase